MEKFKVIVTIENKPSLSDPEGRTILKDLVLKEGKSDEDRQKVNETDSDFNSQILDIRTAKMLKFTIMSTSADTAVDEIKGVCERLHIYNPIVSTLCVSAEQSIQ